MIKIHNQTLEQIEVVMLDAEQQNNDLRWGSAVRVMAGVCARWKFPGQGHYVARAYFQDAPENNTGAAVSTGSVYQVRLYRDRIFLTAWNH